MLTNSVPLSSFRKPKPPAPRSCFRPSAMSTLKDRSPSSCVANILNPIYTEYIYTDQAIRNTGATDNIICFVLRKPLFSSSLAVTKKFRKLKNYNKAAS